MVYLLFLSSLLGLSSVITQVLVMRELVVVFNGNEMSYAVALAAWFVGIAVGSLVLRADFFRRLSSWGLLRLFVLLSGVAIPLTIVGIRFLRSALGLLPGQLTNIFSSAMASFCVIFPVTFLLGGFFVLLCRQAEEEKGGEKGFRSLKVYATEASGFVAGGVVFSFLLAGRIEGLALAFMLLFLHIMAVIGRTDRRILVLSIGMIAVAMVLFLFSGAYRHLETWSRSLAWPGYHVLVSEDTRYGNITVLERDGERSLFENGGHVFTTGDALSVEEAAHVPLLMHSHPQRVLLVGGGVSGIVEEVLKHPVSGVDDIELDPATFRIGREFFAKTSSALNDRRVRLILDDARRYVKRTSERYDVVIINISDPLTLMNNRFYTFEFFREVRRVMAPQGIFCLGVSSSVNYLNDEARDYLRSIETTLRKVFPDIVSIPGDRHIFVAAAHPLWRKEEGPLADVLAKRLLARDVRAQYVRPTWFSSRMDPWRMSDVENILEREGEVDHDARPIGFLRALMFWSTHLDTTFAKAMDLLLRWSWALFVLPLGILLGRRQVRRDPGAALPFAVLAAGFVQIVTQVIVLMMFQAFFGYLYSAIGSITAVFMCGTAVGAWIGERTSRDRVSVFFVLRMAQGAAVIVPVCAVLLFMFDLPTFAGYVGFFGLSFLTGVVGGMIFVLANAARVAMGEASSFIVGGFYALDAIGAASGALVAGICLVPMWGVAGTLIFCALLNAAVLVLFFIQPDHPNVGRTSLL